MGRHGAVIGDNLVFGGQALDGAVDDRAKFGRVLRLAPHYQSAARVVDAEPSGVAILFLRSMAVTDLQEECLHDEFLDAIAQPGVALGLQIEVKMLRLDGTNRPGLL